MHLERQTRTLDVPGSRIGNEMVRRLSRWTVGSHRQQDGTAIQRNMSSHLHKYQCLDSWSLEAKKWETYHSLQRSFYKYRTLVSNNSFRESDQFLFAAMTDWCCQFGLTNEETERVAIPVDNGLLTRMQPEEVDILVSPPNLALGNKMHGDMRFRRLEEKVHMTQLCEKASLQLLDSAVNF